MQQFSSNFIHEFSNTHFWNPDHYEIRPEAIEYFDILKEAGILHFDPVKASHKVNAIYEDVDTWWASSDLQKVRTKFCERFASQSVNWLNEWSMFLRGVSAVDQK